MSEDKIVQTGSDYYLLFGEDAKKADRDDK